MPKRIIRGKNETPQIRIHKCHCCSGSGRVKITASAKMKRPEHYRNCKTCKGTGTQCY